MEDTILWGEANPCGRLAETFPMRLQDTPSYLSFPGDGKKVIYSEDVFVGYRWYDSREIPVRWAFGHGLSYTTFSYENMGLSGKDMDDCGELTVSVDVCNTGTVFGKEVVQLYVRDKKGTFGRPVKELKGFGKVTLNPRECKTVSMTLRARDLSYWHEELGGWYAPSGTYEVSVGRASDDICLREEIRFTPQTLLPLTVTPATTVGELTADPRTAEKGRELMENAVANSTLDMSDPAMALMAEEMMKAMPIKTLPSFGMLPADRVDEVVREINLRIDGSLPST